MYLQNLDVKIIGFLGIYTQKADNKNMRFRHWQRSEAVGFRVGSELFVLATRSADPVAFVFSDCRNVFCLAM